MTAARSNPSGSTPFPLQNSEFKEALQFFNGFLDAERNVSKETLRAYRNDVEELLLFLEREGFTLETVDPAAIRSFFTYITGGNFRSKTPDQRALTGNSKNRRLSARTQARKLSALRTFFRFLVHRGRITNSPVEGIPTPKFYRPLPGVIPDETLQELLEGDAKPEHPLQEVLAIRDRAIWEILYSSGMRISELLSLKVDELTPGESRVKVTGKGGVDRIVFFGPQSRDALDRYLERRDELSPSTDALFVNHRGRALNARGVRYRIREWCRAAGITRALSPHKFRHTFATDLLNEGADIRAVQELLGHKSISTTQIYTAVSRDRLREVHRNCHPRYHEES